jgi:hypothetical protein
VRKEAIEELDAIHRSSNQIKSCMKQICLSAAILLTSCATKDAIKVEVIPNPMLSLWSKIGDKIESLESRNAKRDEWQMSSVSETIITDQAQLKVLLVRSRLDPIKQSQALEAYKPSRLVAHYGFEADYHALVIYGANDKPASVFKW